MANSPAYLRTSPARRPAPASGNAPIPARVFPFWVCLSLAFRGAHTRATRSEGAREGRRRLPSHIPLPTASNDCTPIASAPSGSLLPRRRRYPCPHSKSRHNPLLHVSTLCDGKLEGKVFPHSCPVHKHRPMRASVLLYGGRTLFRPVCPSRCKRHDHTHTHHTTSEVGSMETSMPTRSMGSA